MAALFELTRLFSGSQGLREVSQPFTELAVNALRCEGAVLALREGKESHLSISGAVGDRADVIRSQLFSDVEGIVGAVTRSGEPLMIPEAKRDQRLKKEGSDYISREPRNALCVPVPGLNSFWGALLLVNTRDRKRFNRQDIDLLGIMTLRLGQELDREAESGQAKGEAARFSTLLRIGEMLHASQDAGKIQDLLVQLSMRMVKAQGVAVLMLDETQQNLVCLASSEKANRVIQIPTGIGVAGWVAIQGQAVSTILQTDPKFSGQFEPVFSFKVDNVLAVPIKGSRGIGVLEAVNKSGSRGFDEADTSILSILAREAGIALENISRMQESQRTIMDLLKGMARYLDAKAPYLIGHSERVARLSQVIGEEIGLPPDEIQKLYLEGLLHDLGNVGVDDELFLRTSKLTEDEMGRVRQHASIGAEILRDVTALRHLMAGPLYHHERYDGNGYPQGLKGEQIPFHARIVGVAEAFDALRSSRPYREAFSVADTISQLRESSGIMFDPKVVLAIVSAFQRGKIHG